MPESIFVSLKQLILENVIYNELRMRGYRVDVGVVTIAGKDADGKVKRKQLEVDFVCNLGSSRYYIQSAFYFIAG